MSPPGAPGVAYVVVPDGVDDPARPSGGNIYDRRICRGLAAIGWSVHESAVPGRWPWPDPAARGTLRGVLAGIPDDAVVLIDGLIASSAPEVLVPQSRRLRLVVLVHMPLGGLECGRELRDGPWPGGSQPGDRRGVPSSGSALSDPGPGAAAPVGRTSRDLPGGGLPGEAVPGDAVPDGDVPLDEAVHIRERAALSAATAVVTTSAWTRDRLVDRYALQPNRVHVAQPGVDAADIAPGTPVGRGLLCVAAVTPLKGHDLLFTALGAIKDIPWCCACVGSLDRDPGFVDRLRDQLRDNGIGQLVSLTGPLTGADLDAVYAAADVVVLASRFETYGMVVTEALARGLPVIAPDVGGLPEALGFGADGGRPGLLVRPRDPAALSTALRHWLGDGDLRERLRQAARERRDSLTGWSVTSSQISRALSEVAA